MVFTTANPVNVFNAGCHPCRFDRGIVFSGFDTSDRLLFLLCIFILCAVYATVSFQITGVRENSITADCASAFDNVAVAGVLTDYFKFRMNCMNLISELLLRFTHFCVLSFQAAFSASVTTQ